MIQSFKKNSKFINIHIAIYAQTSEMFCHSLSMNIWLKPSASVLFLVDGKSKSLSI